MAWGPEWRALHTFLSPISTAANYDPLGWLPDEPGLRDTSVTSPCATETAGGDDRRQPESADPAPHSPPVKEKVPESPPDDGTRGEGKHGKRHGEARDGSAAHDGKRSGKKQSRHDAAWRRMRTSRRAMRRTAEIALANETEPESATRTERDRKMPPAAATAEAAKVGVIPPRQTGAQTAKPATTEAVRQRGTQFRNTADGPPGTPSETMQAVPTSRARRDERGANPQNTEQGERDGGGDKSNHSGVKVWIQRLNQ